MERKETYTIDAVLSKVVLDPTQNRDVNFDGDLVHMDSQRYVLFKTKGINCIGCGLIGKFFAKERSKNEGPFHFNLYGVKDGHEILMTKDHIIPIKNKGKNNISNYQPFCEKCQQEKENLETRQNFQQFLTDVRSFSIYGFTIFKLSEQYYSIENAHQEYFTQDRIWENSETISTLIANFKVHFTLPTAIIIVQHLKDQIIYREATVTEQMFDKNDKGKLFDAQYRNVKMLLCITNDFVSIYDIVSENSGHGEAQQALTTLKNDFKDKRIFSSVPLNSTMTHILDKLQIEYQTE